MARSAADDLVKRRGPERDDEILHLATAGRRLLAVFERASVDWQLSRDASFEI